MAQVVISSLAELKQLVGTEVATTGWLTVSQERIDRFAEATEDRQWIHVDPVRAAKDSPYRTTVAHGFLTLSLLSHLLQQAIDMQGVRLGINYGLNRVRFTGPVPAGSRLRARFKLAAVEDISKPVSSGASSQAGKRGTASSRAAQTTWEVTIEREGAKKPVLIAEWLTRRYD